jgi:hypothetical protein
MALRQVKPRRRFLAAILSVILAVILAVNEVLTGEVLKAVAKSSILVRVRRTRDCYRRPSHKWSEVFPQGLKRAFLLALCGTAKAVPYPKRFMR